MLKSSLQKQVISVNEVEGLGWLWHKQVENLGYDNQQVSRGDPVTRGSSDEGG